MTQTDINEVTSLITRLDTLRGDRDRLETKIKTRRLEVAEALAKEQKVDVDTSNAIYNEITELQSRINEKAIQYFIDHKKKTFVAGVKIQETKKLEYNREIAETWARSKGLFLTFDIQGFEKAALSLGLDFVTESKSLRTTYPAKLDLSITAQLDEVM